MPRYKYLLCVSFFGSITYAILNTLFLHVIVNSPPIEWSEAWYGLGWNLAESILTTAFIFLMYSVIMFFTYLKYTVALVKTCLIAPLIAIRLYYLLTSSEFDTEVSLAKAVYANLGLIIHGGAIFFFNLKPGYVNKEEDEIKEIGQSL